MDEDYKYNLTESKNDSYQEDNIKNYNNNLNNLFSLYNNFFIKKIDIIQHQKIKNLFIKLKKR